MGSFLTVTVKVWLSKLPRPSETWTVIAWLPMSEAVGVQRSLPVLESNAMVAGAETMEYNGMSLMR